MVQAPKRKTARQRILESLSKQAGVAMMLDRDSLIRAATGCESEELSPACLKRFVDAVTELVAKGDLREHKVYGTKVYGLS